MQNRRKTGVSPFNSDGSRSTISLINCESYSTVRGMEREDLSINIESRSHRISIKLKPTLSKLAYESRQEQEPEGSKDYDRCGVLSIMLTSLIVKVSRKGAGGKNFQSKELKSPQS